MKKFAFNEEIEQEHGYYKQHGGQFTDITFGNPVKQLSKNVFKYTLYFRILSYLHDTIEEATHTRKDIFEYALGRKKYARGQYSCLFSDLKNCSLIDHSRNNYNLSEQGIRYVDAVVDYMLANCS